MQPDAAGYRMTELRESQRQFDAAWDRIAEQFHRYVVNCLVNYCFYCSIDVAIVVIVVVIHYCFTG